MHSALIPGTMALALAVTLPGVALASGTLISVEGRVTVERGQQAHPAAAATPLASGDTLVVGALGRATVQFEDDSVFSVPGPARLRVDEFRMPTAGAGGKAVFTLKEGGLRTVTGRISKSKEDRYELRAEEATVTVSGSSYSTLRCARQCGQHKPGLYVRGEKGIIVVANAAGRMRLSGGKVAYVESSTKLPVEIVVSPFSDPALAGAYGFDFEIDGEAHPPRIEQDPPASPS